MNINGLKENQSIEVRGYLYRDLQGQIVLTDTPNMKSCCLGKTETHQIYLTGSFPETLPVQLSVVRGVLKKGDNPYLDEAELVSSAGSLGVSLFFFAVLFLVLFTAYFLKKRP